MDLTVPIPQALYTKEDIQFNLVFLYMSTFQRKGNAEDFYVKAAENNVLHPGSMGGKVCFRPVGKLLGQAVWLQHERETKTVL